MVALDYAKTRVQGADLTATSKDAPRVTITHHPDVRRSLMVQKAYAEGMRALYLYTASFRDQVIEAEAAGTADSEEAKLAARVNDLLLPIVKGFGSERATQLLTAESLQTLGGSGYLQDYPIEQYIRDSKIDTLYEGTTAIQGQDFFFRKIVKDGGVALTWLAEPDPGHDRRRGRQRPAQGGAGAAGHRALRRPGHADGDVRPPHRGPAGHALGCTRSARTPAGCCWPPAT